MKSLVRNAALYGLALYAVSYLLSGLHINGGVFTFVLGGIILAILSFFLKPILNILTLPLNLLTFGAFSFFTNAIIVYLLTVLVPQIQIVPFVFRGFAFAGFIVPSVSFNTFFAYIVCSFALSVIISISHWFVR